MGEILKGKGYTEGVVQAEAIVSTMPFGFWQGIDSETGLVKDTRHDLYGQSLQGKVFIYPYGRGSTANSGVFVDAVRNKMAPAALINVKTEPMIIVGAGVVAFVAWYAIAEWLPLPLALAGAVLVVAPLAWGLSHAS